MIAIVEAYKAGKLSRQHWLPNMVSGAIVGVVALPLAMAFAIASGAKPEQGLYTAIVAGLLSALLGGSRLQISGPTGAFIVILAGITAKHGIGGLQIATLMAGIILLAMGFARLGAVIKFIPEPVIVGFTTGIGLIIFVGQWKDFFGLEVSPTDGHFHQKLGALLAAASTVHWATLGLGLLGLGLLVIWPRIASFRKVPAPLVAMVAVTTLQALFQFDGVATIGSSFGGIPQTLPSFAWPDMTVTQVISLIGPAFTIALLGAIESLLSAVVADGMAGTRHNSNQELIGQGIANIASPLFGGFASTGAIARTATNIRNGGTSPISGIAHVLTLVLIILSLAPLAAYIPLCALAAILFVVAYNMSEMHHFLYLGRTAPKTDVVVLVVTFGLTVLADLVIAVNVGVVIASLLFMRRMARAVSISESSDVAIDDTGSRDLRWPEGTMVYSIDGPFFFGAAEKLEQTLESIQAHQHVLVLRLGRVPFMDATGIGALAELIGDCGRRGTRVILCELNDAVRGKLARAGLLKSLGPDAVFATALAALKHIELTGAAKGMASSPTFDTALMHNFETLSARYLMALDDRPGWGQSRAAGESFERGMHTTLFAAALGARDGRVLVVEQAVNGQTRIGPPAAQVEQGESIVDAAIRQCRESSGYPFVPTALVGVYRWTGAAAGADYLYVALAGECQNSGEPVDPSVKAVRWLSLAELEATESIQHNPVALNSARDLLSGRRFPLDTLHDWDGTGAARNKRN